MSAVTPPVVPHRSRLTLALLGSSTVILGLATRRVPSLFPWFVQRWGGDVLWAGLVYWLLAFMRPSAPVWKLASTALAISFVVEFSQLMQVPWLVALRATRPGALALGQGFLWSDLGCYAVGVLLAGVIDRWLNRPQPPAPEVAT